MSPDAELHALDAFLADVYAAQSIPDLNQAIIKGSRGFGYDRFNVSILHDIEMPPWMQKFALSCNYSDAWVQRYVRKNYVECDPVAQNARSGVSPFFWDDLALKGNLNRSQLKVLGEAREARLFHGVGIPFSGSAGLRGGIALAVSDPDLEHSKNLRLLRTMTGTYYQQLKFLALQEESQRLSLAPRETEVALLICFGKTNPEIARSLGRSKHTINAQVRQIFKKLDVHSRPELVFRCLSCGFFAPE